MDEDEKYREYYVCDPYDYFIDKHGNKVLNARLSEKKPPPPKKELPDVIEL